MKAFLTVARHDEPLFYAPEIDRWVMKRYADVLAMLRPPLLGGQHATLGDDLRRRAADPKRRRGVVAYAWRRRELVRRATCNVEIVGVAIPAHSNLTIPLTSANRGADYFEDPDRFDVCAPNADKHLTFGNGIHFWLRRLLSPWVDFDP
jgi:hypothetical protein